MARPLHPKHYLGQCFLVDKRVIGRIREELRSEGLQGEVILEIGPGKGVLTEPLLELGPERVIAVELDDRLIPVLRERFSSWIQAGRLQLIQGDFRDLDLALSRFSLIANIPYYLTGDVFEFMLDSQGLNKSFLMLQLDVVEKVLAPVGSKKYSYLSVVMQSFFDISVVLRVPPSAFSPRPRVWSAFVRFLPKKTFHDWPAKRKRAYRDMLRSAFSHRRKLLRNSIDKRFLSLLPPDWLNRRAQEFSPEEWLALFAK